jgi:hypothetical protein
VTFNTVDPAIAGTDLAMICLLMIGMFSSDKKAARGAPNAASTLPCPNAGFGFPIHIR